MQMETVLPPLQFLMGTLVTWLRYRLLFTSSTSEKLQIGAAILASSECLHTLRAAAKLAPNSKLQMPPTAMRAAIAAASGCSNTADSIIDLLSVVDGYSTTIRASTAPFSEQLRLSIEMCAPVVRTRLPHPRHLSLERHDESSLGDLRELPWPAIPKVSARERADTPGPGGFLQQLHDNLFGIEIAAAEVCAAMPLRFPDLPDSLDQFLALQTFEELRHARLLVDVFEAYGGKLGAYPISLRIWDNTFKSDSLSEALFIQHFLGEGYALGHDLMAIDEYRTQKIDVMVDVHLSLHEDELDHVRQGVCWYRRLSSGDHKALLKRFEEAVAAVPPPEPWFRSDLRRSVGFLDHEVNSQRSFMERARH